MKSKEISPISRDWRIRLAAYSALGSAYLSAIPLQRPDLFSLVILLGAALGSLFLEHRFPRPFFPPLLKIGLILSGAVVYGIFLLQHRGDLSHSLTLFLVWNSFVFLLSRNKSENDLWTLAILTLSFFMISGAFVQPLRFLPLLGLSLLTQVYTFGRLASLRWKRANPFGIKLWTIQVALVLTLGSVFFFIFPRNLFPPTVSQQPAPPQRVAPEATTVYRTGITHATDPLSLRMFQKIKMDRTPVLQLQFLSDTTALNVENLRYLRGEVRSRYERGAWISDLESGSPLHADNQWIGLPPQADFSGATLGQHIWLEPVAGRLLFALAEPVRIRLPEVRTTPSGTLFLSSPAERAIEYEVVSRLPGLEDRPNILSESELRRYLQLPPGMEGLRRMALSRTPSSSPSKMKMEALAGILSPSTFRYSLTAFDAPQGIDPVEYFLTQKKEGCCIHFATALALLGRAAGVPCRIATGFHFEEFDPATGRFILRHSDSHAWVEAFLDGSGWVRFDPTPAEQEPELSEGTPVATQPGAGANPTPSTTTPETSRWDSFLTDYTGDGLRKLKNGWQYLGGIAVLMLVWIVYLIRSRRDRKKVLQGIVSPGRKSNVDFYQAFLKILSRRGLQKLESQTAREFGEHVRTHFPGGGIDYLIERFYRVRYAGIPLDPEEKDEIRKILRRL